MSSGTSNVGIVIGSAVIAAILIAINYTLFSLYHGSSIAEWETIAVASALIIGGLAVSISKGFPKNFSEKDMALTVSFGVLLYVAQFVTGFVPAFVYYVPPISYVATDLLIYLPQGIIFAALITMVHKPGSIFSMMVPFYILSMISYFNPIWTLFYFGWAGAAELVIWLGKDGLRLSGAAMISLLFGVADAALVAIFSLFVMGVYTLPILSGITAASAGVFCAVGGALGYFAGRKGRSVWKP
ncbi:MAG: hypothetical protein JRN19_02105 [Nitrososphaerota archaeon]|nr:hypothetical protein [Nitrososphaerota archaeon]MDG7048743.1 hypothetical protein [Nitrososphaerota archaeon]MDG7051228.1 hypothetical protein [Nitrososphaerota archaeon]